MIKEYHKELSFLQDIPIDSGDVVLFASDISSFIDRFSDQNIQELLNKWIDILQYKIGRNGTLLFPTYNWGFCHGKAWDYYKTKSKTGVLSNIALKRKDFRRTKHPIYSFAVWGKDQDILCQMDDCNSFLGDTPFAYLASCKKAKFIAIDVNLTDSFTFVHYAEEKIGVPFRYKKNFIGNYIGSDGIEMEKTYSMYVRCLDKNVAADCALLEKELLLNGYMQQIDKDGILMRIVQIKPTYDLLIEHLLNKEYEGFAQFDK